MRRCHPVIVTMICAAVVAGGCARYPGFSAKSEKPSIPERPPEPFDSVIESSYVVGGILAESLRHRRIPKDRPILAASFVSIDNLEESSTLGRVLSEQIANRLAGRGYKIVEIKLRKASVFVKKGAGEFMLSRNLRDITETNDVHAVLVGTYAVAETTVFVSARVVMAEDSSVIAGQEYELALDYAAQSLLE